MFLLLTFNMTSRLHPHSLLILWKHADFLRYLLFQKSALYEQLMRTKARSNTSVSMLSGGYAVGVLSRGYEKLKRATRNKMAPLAAVVGVGVAGLLHLLPELLLVDGRSRRARKTSIVEYRWIILIACISLVDLNILSCYEISLE